MNDDSAPSPRSPWSWRSFIIGAIASAVLLGGIGGGIAIKVAVDAARQQAYSACMSAFGYGPDDEVVTDEQLERAFEVAEVCSQS